MDKTKLAALIAALYLLEIKERGAYIREAAKESGVDEGELFKALKEAGYNPKAEKGSAAPGETPPAPVPDGGNTHDGGPAAGPEADGAASRPPENGTNDRNGLIPVTLRHKTDYPRYRRAGLVLKQSPEAFLVTAEQLAALEKDPWVAVKKEGGDK